VIAWLKWIFYTLTGQEAVRLNLRVNFVERFVSGPYVVLHHIPVELLPILGVRMAKIGDKFVARIAPTNAAGKPAPVTDVLFAELSDRYDEVAVSDDVYSVTFEAVVSGSGATVTVSGTSKSGAVLTAAAALPDVEAPPADEEAVALNLTVVPA